MSGKQGGAPGIAASRGLLAKLRRHPAAILLVVQVCGILCYPLFEHVAIGRALFGAFGIIALALVLWVINRSPAVNWVAWPLAILSVGLSLFANFGGHPALLGYAHALESVLYFYAAAGLIFYMLSDYRVTTDEVVAAATTFTLLAWGFAFAFSACQIWIPGSFSANGGSTPRTWVELLYASFGILSGAGLGDVGPVLPVARALATLAMFSGVMYIAIVVSRLIALTVMRHQAK